MYKIKLLSGFFLFLFLLSGDFYCFAGDLKWEYSANSAFSRAISEKKKILLFVGRKSCGNCKYMVTRVFETEKPPVKELLINNFVLWFSDADDSKEWYRTARNLETIPLPLICVIDPKNPSKAYEDRTTGKQHSPSFYSRLLKHTDEAYQVVPKAEKKRHNK